MSTIILQADPPSRAPLSTVVASLAKFRRKKGRGAVLFGSWDVRLSCGHWVHGLKGMPYVGEDRRRCQTCKKLRTPRTWQLIRRMARMGLTEDEVEYLAGRLIEQRDRQDGGK